MNTAENLADAGPATPSAAFDSSLESAVAAACGRIAPTWPLDRFIAVNPYWGWIERPFEQVAGDLRRFAGSPLAMPHRYYRDAWRRGEIGPDDLSAAIEESGTGETVERLSALIEQTEAEPSGLPLPSEIADARSGEVHRPAWSDSITHQISQFCAAWFDEAQADWHPPHGEALYDGWRQAIRGEQGTALLMGVPGIIDRARRLPADARSLIVMALDDLNVPAEQRETVLLALLLRVNGWASWCAYRRWEARLDGGDDDDIVELLAIRLAWEWLLDDGRRDGDSTWARWQQALRSRSGDAERTPAAIWQRAQELAYQRTLTAALEGPREDAAETAQPEVQAAFCIDVRSEVFRRALERALPGVQTLGFAGFFGLPIAYTPLGTGARRPQLPGLLAPALETTDSCGDAHADAAIAARRRASLDAGAPWRAFARVPASAFTLVEAQGLGYLGKLLRRSLRPDDEAPVADGEGLARAARERLRPVLAGGSLEDRAELAERVLRAMSLTDRFARWVLLAGHGSRSANNPHAAGLDCGACCGQTGEVNARALAALLNDADVRASLVDRGIRIPESTRFVAALHDTTIDEVQLYDVESAEDREGGEGLTRVKQALAEAGRLARAERAPALGLSELTDRPDELRRAIRVRGGDWSQTRPEWGLAGTPARGVAPRGGRRGVDLGGRSFLHDYDWRADTDGSVIELIMTAPMVVTHWINMQYYASTVDHRRYGSGNKVIHNVVGGRIGVFEGNGGDLRIGLSMQSLHDGERWMHAPLRLSVFIEAPREMIDTVIENHELVRQLIDNRWLYLFRIDPESGHVESRQDGEWRASAPAQPTR
jgi:uncharacterized protein YbcC (UPF0753/DUF2309 family)